MPWTAQSSKRPGLDKELALRPPQTFVGNGPNTVSESTVSNTELSEFFCPHRVPGRELSELLSVYYLCAKANSPSFRQNSPSLPQNSVSSLFRNSTLETVFRPFPISRSFPSFSENDFSAVDTQTAVLVSIAKVWISAPDSQTSVCLGSKKCMWKMFLCFVCS